MNMSGCMYQVNVFEAREEMRMKVFQALISTARGHVCTLCRDG